LAKDIAIKISELRLDPENPRITGDHGQINIRQALLDDQGSKIGELAADIAKYQLNPMDRLMVLQPDKSKNEYVTLEGNRRAAALQILANPSLLEDLAIPDALRNKLINLADDFDPKSVEPIPAVVMPDRESARRWIELRHTGQNNGRGIVDWNSVQTARFRGDRTLDLLEFVKLKGSLTAEEKTAIASNFPITTLDRIVSNPQVRQKLGIQITDGEYYFTFPQKEVLKALKHVVLDLATKKIKVDAVKNKEQQIEYVDGIPKTSMPSGPKLKVAESVSDILKVQPAPPPSQPEPAPSPLNRKTLVPKSFVLTIANGKAAQLFYELRTLNIEKFPIAGAISLRSFVEAVVEIYCSFNQLATKHVAGKNAGKSFSLAQKVEAVLVHVGPSLTKQENTAARTSLTAPDSVISVSRLNEYVHNPAMFPSKNDLIAAWSGVEAFFKVTCK
jgi:hypothetical protein